MSVENVLFGGVLLFVLCAVLTMYHFNKKLNT